jgi:hypothetical protein
LKYWKSAHGQTKDRKLRGEGLVTAQINKIRLVIIFSEEGLQFCHHANKGEVDSATKEMGTLTHLDYD